MIEQLVIGIYPHLSLGAICAYTTSSREPCAYELISTTPDDDLRDAQQRYYDAVQRIKADHEGVEVHSVNIRNTSRIGDKPPSLKVYDQSRFAYMVIGRMCASEPQVNMVYTRAIKSVCTAHNRKPIPDENFQLRTASETAYAVLCVLMHEALALAYPSLAEGW